MSLLVKCATVTAQSVTLRQVVEQADPLLGWVAPAAIPFGTALGPDQLGATAAVAGTFLYTPAAGVYPHAGMQTLSVAFIPANPGYKNASVNVGLLVIPPGSSSYQIAMANPKVTIFTVSTKQDTRIVLNIAPIGDFHQPVTLACAPSNFVTCTFTPAILRPTTQPVQVTLTLHGIRFNLGSTLAISGAPALMPGTYSAPPQPKRKSLPVSGGPPMLAGIAGLAWLGMRRRDFSAFRHVVLLLAIASLLPVSCALLGCGSDSQLLSVLTITGSSLVESKSLSITIVIPPQ